MRVEVAVVTKLATPLAEDPFFRPLFFSEIFFCPLQRRTRALLLSLFFNGGFIWSGGAQGRQELKLSCSHRWNLGKRTAALLGRDVWGVRPIQRKGIRTKLIAAEAGGTPHNDAGLRPLQELVNYCNHPLGRARESLS